MIEQMAEPQSHQQKLFESATEFSIYIEKRAQASQITLVESILAFCEENGSEPEDVKNLISKPLKDKLEVEYQNMNYLKKTPTLDI